MALNAIVRLAHRLSHRAALLPLAVAGLVTLTACSSGAPQPAPKATSAPAQATATRAPAAASPAASPKPAASPGASPVASPGAAASASPVAANGARVLITDASLADATRWATIRNVSGAPIDLTGWRLEVGSQSAPLPENVTLESDETLILHARSGENSDREFFLGQAGEALANAATPGTRVRLLDASGQVAAETTVPRF
jgi:Lamin Tail Domain